MNDRIVSHPDGDDPAASDLHRIGTTSPVRQPSRTCVHHAWRRAGSCTRNRGQLSTRTPCAAYGSFYSGADRWRRSSMPACSWPRSALRALHRTQEATQLVQFVPPLRAGHDMVAHDRFGAGLHPAVLAGVMVPLGYVTADPGRRNHGHHRKSRRILRLAPERKGRESNPQGSGHRPKGGRGRSPGGSRLRSGGTSVSSVSVGDAGAEPRGEPLWGRSSMSCWRSGRLS